MAGETLVYGSLQGPPVVRENVYKQTPTSPLYEDVGAEYNADVPTMRSLTSSLVRKVHREAWHSSNPEAIMARLVDDMQYSGKLKQKRIGPVICTVLNYNHVPPDERERYYEALAAVGVQLASHELVLDYLSLFIDRFRNNGNLILHGDQLPSYIKWISGERPEGVSGSKLKGLKHALPQGFATENGHLINGKATNPVGNTHGSHTGHELLKELAQRS